MTEIICHGNELASTIASVRSQGGRVEAMDAKFGGNPAQYRLEVFYGRVAEQDARYMDGGCRSKLREQPLDQPTVLTEIVSRAHPLKPPVAPPDTDCSNCGGPVPENCSCGICTPLARLKTRLQEKKRLRTPKSHARLPHASD